MLGDYRNRIIAEKSENMTTDSAFVILVEILMSLIMVVVILGNLFVIGAVCRYTRLRTIPNICITSLAIADLFVGLLNIPMYMYAVYEDEFKQKYSEQFTLALKVLDMYFGAASILHLSFISMERCYAITCPLRRKFLQKGRQKTNCTFLNQTRGKSCP